MTAYKRRSIRKMTLFPEQEVGDGLRAVRLRCFWIYRNLHSLSPERTFEVLLVPNAETHFYAGKQNLL